METCGSGCFGKSYPAQGSALDDATLLMKPTLPDSHECWADRRLSFRVPTHPRKPVGRPCRYVFTQTDPLQADVGSPYPSSYVYGNNNPLVYTDPTGLRAIYSKYLTSPNPDFVLTENLSPSFKQAAGHFILSASTDLECGERLLQYVARFRDITTAVAICRNFRNPENVPKGWTRTDLEREAGNLRKWFVAFDGACLR